jgi:hypothetical protein
MTFCTIVGHASFHTAGTMAPSTIERSNFCVCAGGVSDTEALYRERLPE